MGTPDEDQNPESFRSWLNRQIGILLAVILIVGTSVYMDRQSREQGNPSTAFIEEMQLSDPVETGTIPSRVLEEPWMKEYGHD